MRGKICTLPFTLWKGRTTACRKTVSKIFFPRNKTKLRKKIQNKQRNPFEICSILLHIHSDLRVEYFIYTKRKQHTVRVKTVSIIDAHTQTRTHFGPDNNSSNVYLYYWTTKCQDYAQNAIEYPLVPC